VKGISGDISAKCLIGALAERAAAVADSSLVVQARGEKAPAPGRGEDARPARSASASEARP